ncbi:type II toxin-antitoxin system VapC family toxin [Rhizobium leguminosarum bv. viciae]|nr:type II toxin-antitoxin system VapC family toxin [Rhizobium leguminosarum bv. viciae]
MTTAFLLDTCVISETALPRPRESVIEFLAAASNYFIPIGALMELQMGITKVCATNPIKAVKLSAWYNQLIKAGIPTVETDSEIGALWGILAIDPKLQGLNGADGRTKRTRGGQDLHIAAAALSRRLPIATMNIRDFMRIHELYPLPGIYDPSTGIWHAKMEPLSELYPIANSNDRLREPELVEGGFSLAPVMR